MPRSVGMGNGTWNTVPVTFQIHCSVYRVSVPMYQVSGQHRSGLPNEKREPVTKCYVVEWLESAGAAGRRGRPKRALQQAEKLRSMTNNILQQLSCLLSTKVFQQSPGLNRARLAVT